MYNILILWSLVSIIKLNGVLHDHKLMWSKHQTIFLHYLEHNGMHTTVCLLFKHVWISSVWSRSVVYSGMGGPIRKYRLSSVQNLFEHAYYAYLRTGRYTINCMGKETNLRIILAGDSVSNFRGLLDPTYTTNTVEHRECTTWFWDMLESTLYTIVRPKSPNEMQYSRFMW